MATFGERVLGALRLDVQTFEEVEADRSATGQAMLVVVLASIASGIGTLGQGGRAGFVGGLLGALGGWVVWAFLTYWIGTRLLPAPETRADMGQLLRTIGFAQSPGLLRVLGIVPILGRLVLLVSAIWMLAAFVVAVRQALDYRGTGRAAAVCAIGFLAYLAVSAVIFLLFGIDPRSIGGRTS